MNRTLPAFHAIGRRVEVIRSIYRAATDQAQQQYATKHGDAEETQRRGWLAYPVMEGTCEVVVNHFYIHQVLAHQRLFRTLGLGTKKSIVSVVE